MKPHIVVIGSSNTDMVIQADHIPAPGETILGGTFFMNPGGKGANQAVAAARLGGNVTFICKTGSDIFGRQAKENFQREGINTQFVFSDEETPSGVALITIDDRGENSIVVASGANANLSIADIEKAMPVIERAGFILMQLEIPMETVEYVASLAAKKNKRVILNPAPAQLLAGGLLNQINIITPNETEAQILTGITVSDALTATQAARTLQDQGIEIVVITMGAEGVLLMNESEVIKIPAVPVNAVDTTAAGDIFSGALTVALSENMRVEEAVRFACQAAAISVTRYGAQSSAPYRNEIG
jgi:ribokinase